MNRVGNLTFMLAFGLKANITWRVEGSLLKYDFIQVRNDWN